MVEHETDNSTYVPGPYDDAINYTVLFASAAMVIVSTCISAYLIYKHLANYTRPAAQRCIVRIIAMVPLYGVYSFLCLFFYEWQVYFSIARDTYEAYALYMFFALCVEYAGGWPKMVEIFASGEKRRCLAPFCCFRVQPGRRLLRWCQRGILQYALIRPIVTILSAVFLVLDLYAEGEWRWDRFFLYATILNNLGVTTSLYFLVLFYQITKKELLPYKPLLKFSVIKGIVFFCYWQSVMIAILISAGWLPKFRDWDDSRLGITLQNICICIEMLVFSILYLYAFPYDIYQLKAQSQAPLVQQYAINRGFKKSIKDALNQKDLAKDTLDAFVPEKVRRKAKSIHNQVSLDIEDSRDTGTTVDLDSEESSSSSISEELVEDNTKLKKTARR